ncbi:pyrimidine-nucleoside phosphorylase [Streptococcus pneumoniae]|nr:pyrimidine-nucleoside phosphorylase [Streptococcus pneumoniae]
MRAVDLIQKKRDGQELTSSEIEWLIEGYVSGTVPDYQMSAFAMAVYFKGMTTREISDLTMNMVKTGQEFDLSAIDGVKVDKHSTGGVGDKVTLILAPLVASFGVPVAKMSGRGLGHTGGTIDKLESIKGYQVERSQEDFIRQVQDIGVSVIGQSDQLVKADKLLYALRDVTATVDTIPLIASSVMSKKIAAGADAILLDVTVGEGAFMKTVDEARELAQTMVDLGKVVGRKTVAVITDMSQPLGRAIGNRLEIVWKSLKHWRFCKVKDVRILPTLFVNWLKLCLVWQMLTKLLKKFANILRMVKHWLSLRKWCKPKVETWKTSIVL